MPDLDWSQCEAVESIPGKVSGAWVFKNTRMPVSVIFANLASGASMAEIMEWFNVTAEQYRAVLEFALNSLDDAPNLMKRMGPLPEWGNVITTDDEEVLADAHSA